MPAKKINSLEDITELQWTQLARKVIESNRRVIVLVHPLYNPASQKYSGSLAGLLKKSKIPIIILEEAEKIPGLKRAFLNEFKLRKQHLILPTAADYPDLIVEKAKQRKEAEISPDSKKLIEILETLGAKSVFVGGMQAVRHSSKAVKEYEMSWLPKGRKPDRVPISNNCAGSTYANLILSKKFERIRLIPNICSPASPKYKKKKAHRLLFGRRKKKIPSWKRL